MYHVYVIQHSEIKDYYIGYTTDIEKILERHNNGENKSTRRKSGEWVLVYYEAYRSKEDAVSREKRLKVHGKGKQELIKRLTNSKL
jgi:putative endonuclease